MSGGGAVTPEFLAVTIGLTIYTASFVAEIVRSGIQSVPWGQTEAAGALGLSRGQALKLVLPALVALSLLFCATMGALMAESASKAA